MWNKEPYTEGKQPCEDFDPQHSDSGAINVHQCFKCEGRVSFCKSCARDHHENGYEACASSSNSGGT